MMKEVHPSVEQRIILYKISYQDRNKILENRYAYILKIEAISCTIMCRSARITSSIRSAFFAVIDILRRQGCGSFSTRCRPSLKPHSIYKCLYLTTFSCHTVLFPSLCIFPRSYFTPSLVRNLIIMRCSTFG